jgi:hypothetical protein
MNVRTEARRLDATETDPSNRTRKSEPAIGTALTLRLSARTVFETAGIDHAAILFTPD